MTYYLPLIGPYSTYPTIYMWDSHRFELPFQHVTRYYAYKAEVGGFETVMCKSPKDLSNYAKFCHKSLDAAFEALLKRITEKGYEHKSIHFEALRIHWPEYFI